MTEELTPTPVEDNGEAPETTQQAPETTQEPTPTPEPSALDKALEAKIRAEYDAREAQLKAEYEAKLQPQQEIQKIKDEDLLLWLEKNNVSIDDVANRIKAKYLPEDPMEALRNDVKTIKETQAQRDQQLANEKHEALRQQYYNNLAELANKSDNFPAIKGMGEAALVDAFNYAAHSAADKKVLPTPEEALKYIETQIQEAYTKLQAIYGNPSPPPAPEKPTTAPETVLTAEDETRPQAILPDAAYEDALEQRLREFAKKL